MTKRASLRALLRLARPLPLLVALCFVLVQKRTVVRAAYEEPDASRALVRAFKARGLEAHPHEVFWLDAPPGSITSPAHRPRALVNAARDGEPSDVYLVTARFAPDMRLLALEQLLNLSQTSAVGERHLVADSRHVAWTIGDREHTYSVHLVDLQEEPAPHGPGWTPLKRLQHKLTNLQETGQMAGFGRRSFKLDPARNQVSLGLTESALVIHADAERVRIPFDPKGKIEGERFVLRRPHYLSRPGNLVTWAVDRVRAFSWFGQSKMQWLKGVAFYALDRVERLAQRFSTEQDADTVVEGLRASLTGQRVRYSDPKTGWPPAPLKPLFAEPASGEGQWVELKDPAYILTNAGLPAPFLVTFIRPDLDRPLHQVTITLWDPRQVALHPVSGTREPKSATGETGDGIVPRDPKVLGRLLAGINGGFQASHGDWGMMAEGTVYLPPKPYAATVAKLTDGSTAFGTWPNSNAIPKNLVSFRQNLTPLIQDGKENPYGRLWWGGTPPGWEHESRTIRSALCMTQEKFVAYLYGGAIDDQDLISAAKAARCQYALHLDMNPGHTGMEFYRTGPKGSLPPVRHELDSVWEARGEVSGMPGWEFHGRRLLRYMGLMNFPRFIHREARDFFYLTLRPLLPGAPMPARFVTPGGAPATWRIEGLPQHGYPYAIARADFVPDPNRGETKLHAVKLDPRMLRARRRRSVTVANDPIVFSIDKVSMNQAKSHILFTGSEFVQSTAGPSEGAVLVASGYAASDPRRRGAVAVAGIDAYGMLIYLEVATAPDPTRDADLLDAVCRDLGCVSQTFLSRPAFIGIGGRVDLSGHPLSKRRKYLEFLRATAPGARRIFESTPVVPRSIWKPLQERQSRYARSHD